MKRKHYLGVGSLAIITPLLIGGLTTISNQQDHSSEVVSSKNSELTRFNNESKNGKVSYKANLEANAGIYTCRSSYPNGASYGVGLKTSKSSTNSVGDIHHNGSIPQAAEAFIREFYNLKTNVIKDVFYEADQNKIVFRAEFGWNWSCTYQGGSSSPYPEHIHYNGGVSGDFYERSKGKLKAVADVVMKLDKPLFEILEDTSNISKTNDGFFKVDEQLSMRGINSNNLAIALNNEFFYARTVYVENQLLIKRMQEDAKLSKYRDSDAYNFVIKNLNNGSIYSFANENIGNYLPNSYFINKINDLDFWIAKIEANDFNPSSFDLNLESKINELIDKYDIASLFKNEEKLSIFDFNDYKLSINWKTEILEEQTNELTIVFNSELKRYEFENGLTSETIGIVDFTGEQKITVSSLIISPNFDPKAVSIPTFNIMNIDDQIIDLDRKNFNFDAAFDITKTLVAKDFYHSREWVSFLIESKCFDEIQIQDILENPTNWYQDPIFIEVITKLGNDKIFKTPDSILSERLGENAGFNDNVILNEYINSIKIKAYDSKNLIKLTIDYNNIDMFGNVIDDNLITKEFDLKLTPEIKGEIIITNVVERNITINEELRSEEEVQNYFLENLIDFKDSTNSSNHALQTTLTKDDWIENAFVGMNQKLESSNVMNIQVEFLTNSSEVNKSLNVVEITLKNNAGFINTPLVDNSKSFPLWATISLSLLGFFILLAMLYILYKMGYLAFLDKKPEEKQNDYYFKSIVNDLFTDGW
ncbi:MAG: hypothetical protein ACRC4M_04455 [Mycoplasma sp.]